MFFYECREAIQYLDRSITIVFLLEEFLVVILDHAFQSNLVYDPDAFTNLECLNSILMLFYHSGGMVKLCISVSGLYPFFTGPLEPHKLFLFECIIQVSLRCFFSSFRRYRGPYAQRDFWMPACLTQRFLYRC